MQNATTSLLVLKELAGNPPTSLGALQQLMAPHLDFFVNAWISVWAITACVVLIQLAYDSRRERNKQRKNATKK